MNRQIAMFMHVLAVGLQVANAFGALLPALGLPANYRAAVALVLAGAQAGLGWFQHNFNPDGTPASTAFIPK